MALRSAARSCANLVMPGLLDDAGEIVRWLASELSPDTYVNVMDQYYPAWKAKTEAKFSDINREIRESEAEQALAYAREAGLWRLDRRWRRVRPGSSSSRFPGGLKLVGRLINRGFVSGGLCHFVSLGPRLYALLVSAYGSPSVCGLVVSVYFFACGHWRPLVGRIGSM